MKTIARLLLLAFAGTSTAFAQGYPNRPIKVVVPWPPGQATDIAARLVAEKLVSVLGQPLLLDNRPGAGGTIGTETASKAAPDGYTLLAGSSGPMTISPNVQKLAYDPQKDFAPISLFQTTQLVLVVNPSLPVNNVKELIALLKVNPGKYSFSSAGNASTQHLCVELFNIMAQVTAIHVPYKGSAPSLTDLVGGQVTYTIDTLPAVAGYVKAGRLKALAVSKAKRSALMPDVPTIAEAGNLPGYDMYGWIGLLAPARTPREVTGRLSTEVRKILQAPDIMERFVALGMDSEGSTPEEFAEFIRGQHARYGAIVKQANVKVD
jgi:tripartite-type tricarboxylate transporter receptor subunit TctC